MRIPRSSTYAQFLKRIYQKIVVDSNEYLLKVSAKHSCQYLGRIKETLFPITNDDALSFLLDPEVEIPMLEVYVDAEKIHVEPPHDEPTMGDANPQMSNQWGEYMNLLATPRLPSCSNTDYLAGTSNPDFSAGTSNLDFGAEPTQSHTPLSENFIPNENDVEDPTGDSFVNESDVASEPDEAEYPIPPEDGPDRVDINVKAATFAQRRAETSSEPALPDMNTQPTLYRSIQFFEQTFPEIPADSVDVPNLRAYIASLHLGHVKCNPSYGIKHIIQNVKDQTGYDVPYQKAWYSLKMAREIVYGTWESSVQKLPAYLGAIQKYNPGTIVEWKHKGFQASTGKYVMGYVFWAFKPCIDGFQFCRNIISVDGTHLYTKYKYKLLIAAAMDGNQQGDAGCALFLTVMADSLKQFVKVRTLCHHMECTDQINKEKWTASHDGGWRCGILATNMSECINGVLKGARACRHAQQSASVQIRRQGRHGMNTMLSKLPTENAHAASGINLASLVLTLKKYASEDYWDDPNFQLVHDPTIRTVTRPGRNQTTCIHNEMDWRQTRARQEAQQQQGDSSIQENVP
ncbi:hypothetical protein Sango_2709300 [Sesamum angolense]|uniref:MULE transposase domain-containing protein n=1 Tax=Sesamum angolense TaxID=2727404 RepID=A0AAE1W338_9LAMI|nr:hypothetical protein Sango_2709300 [Sesamum angolense]